jgi:hypothetical protein
MDMLKSEVILVDVTQDELTLHRAKPSLRVRWPERRNLQIDGLLRLRGRRLWRLLCVRVLLLLVYGCLRSSVGHHCCVNEDDAIKAGYVYLTSTTTRDRLTKSPLKSQSQIADFYSEFWRIYKQYSWRILTTNCRMQDRYNIRIQ